MVPFFASKLEKTISALVIIGFLSQLGTAAQSNVSGFAGVEYFGSSQMTRKELAKMISLKPGAAFPSVQRAADKLSKLLDQRHLAANVEVVQASDGAIYVAVDVMDSSMESVPVRNLKEPHHIIVRSEKPFLLLAQLDARLQTLSIEGRPASEKIEDGAKVYSDEAANQLAIQIQKFAPAMAGELLSVLDSDPDPHRRKAAVDILGWAGDIPQMGAKLIESLDDSDPSVRASVVRYLFSRLSYLPDDFPFPALIEGASRELNRPSHQDRSKGLYLLLALARKDIVFMRQIQDLDEARVKQLSEESIVPTIKNPAAELLAIFAKSRKDPVGS